VASLADRPDGTVAAPGPSDQAIGGATGEDDPPTDAPGTAPMDDGKANRARHSAGPGSMSTVESRG
jgi:hypothetical protein